MNQTVFSIALPSGDIVTRKTCEGAIGLVRRLFNLQGKTTWTTNNKQIIINHGRDTYIATEVELPLAIVK